MSPKRVVGCRGGSQYVEGYWGFPYLKITKFLDFLVSKNYQISISCFLEDIDPICRISKKNLRRVGGICRRLSFRKMSAFWVSNILRFTNIICLQISRDFRYLWVPPKIKIFDFGGCGRVQKSRNHRNEGFLFLP